MKTIAYIIAAALAITISLSSCAMAKIEGWPTLATSVHVIPVGEIYSTCIVATPMWQRIVFMPFPVACAYWNLATKTCDIYVTDTTPQSTLDHERAHCQGFDHDTGMREAAKLLNAGK